MTFPKFGKRQSLVAVLVVLGLALLGGAGYFWWQEVYTRPENVFKRMLNNSLSTTSFTKRSVVEGGGQNITQTTEHYLAPDPKVHSLVEISQDDENKSKVKRETLVTEQSNFVRLVSVETTQKTPAGKPFNFSSITGVWGQTPAEEGNNSLAQLYGQNVAVPYAPLTTNQRRQVLEQITNERVYQVKYEAVTRVQHNGRPAYQYQVSVKPDAFIKMMKQVGMYVGVKGFNDVDPNAYKSLPPVNFVFTIDIFSSDLVKVDYGNGQVEDYGSFGKRNATQDPSNAISTLELQQRLQNLQQ